MEKVRYSPSQESTAYVEEVDQPETFAFENLLTMSDQQRKRMKERIAATNGAVEIWIHTHYANDTGEKTKEEIESFARYLEQRDTFISHGHVGKMPVIAFIESNPLIPGSDEVLEDYKTYYGDLKEDKDTLSEIAFVRTFDNHSVPCIIGQEDYSVFSEDTRIDNWNELGGLFHSLGVTTVILRGRNFAYEERDKDRLDTAYTLYVDKHNELAGDSDGTVSVPAKCVGDAMVNLEVRGFRVLSSRLTYPDQAKRTKGRVSTVRDNVS